MRGARARRAVAELALVALVTPIVAVPSVARAEDERERCTVTYEESQVLRKKGELRAAREALHVCARPVCPTFIQADCIEWMRDVERSIPSIVVEARVAGEEVVDVTVSVDGAPITTHLDGRPLDVDPGMHTLRFETAGQPPLERKLLVKAGEKDRLVAVSFGEPPAPPPPKAPAQLPPEEPRTHRPAPPLVFVFGGAGVVGLGAFSVFGLVGSSAEQDPLVRTCAPFCGHDETSAVRTKFIVADIALGIGVVSLATAAYLYFTRPEKPRDAVGR